MGKEFGNLYKMRGIITYKLSPFEQRAFTGMFSHGLLNIFKRILDNVPVVAPPFIIGYLVYAWAEKDYAKRQRKNPADYASDE